MTDDTTEYVTLTDAEGREVRIPKDLVFGEAGDEAPIPFAITGDVFYAASAIPADEFGQLQALLQAMPTQKEGEAPDVNRSQQMLEVGMNMMELFLLPESATRLSERLKSKERPVDVIKLVQIMTKFVKEQYVKAEPGDERPTQPTSDSASG